MSTKRQRLVSICQLAIFALVIAAGMFAIREWMQHKLSRQDESIIVPDGEPVDSLAEPEPEPEPEAADP